MAFTKQFCFAAPLAVALSFAALPVVEQADGASNQPWPLSVAIELDQYVLGFGEDADGELYVLTTEERGPSGTTGRVWRIASR